MGTPAHVVYATWGVPLPSAGIVHADNSSPANRMLCRPPHSFAVTWQPQSLTQAAAVGAWHTMGSCCCYSHQCVSVLEARGAIGEATASLLLTGRTELRSDQVFQQLLWHCRILPGDAVVSRLGTRVVADSAACRGSDQHHKRLRVVVCWEVACCTNQSASLQMHTWTLALRFPIVQCSQAPCNCPHRQWSLAALRGGDDRPPSPASANIAQDWQQARTAADKRLVRSLFPPCDHSTQYCAVEETGCAAASG